MNSHTPAKILSTEPLIYNNLQVICNIPNHAEVMLIEDMPFRLCPWHATDPQVKSCVCVWEGWMDKKKTKERKEWHDEGIEMRVVAKTSSTTDSSICDHPPRPSRSQDYQRVGQISIATCAYHSLPPWLNLISTCSLPSGLRHPWQALPPIMYHQALVVGELACWSVVGYILVLCDVWCVMCDGLKWDEGLLWFPHIPCDCFCPDDEQFVNKTCHWQQVCLKV